MLKVKGFTLVEILVASLIIMLSVTGYVTLQSQYVMADSEINLRYLASQLAHEKVEDLSYFEQLEVKAGKYTFNSITSGNGGAIAAGATYVDLTGKGKNTYLFNVDWKVTDYFYVDTDSDNKADSWVKAGEPFYPSYRPWIADLKSVEVTVHWLNNQGQNKDITVLSHIAPILPSNSTHTK